MRRLHRKSKILAPFGTQERHVAARDAAVHVHNGRAAEADLFHGFEVGGEACFRDVAVHPMPPRLRLGGIGRVEEAGFQRIGGCGGRGEREDEQD